MKLVQYAAVSLISIQFIPTLSEIQWCPDSNTEVELSLRQAVVRANGNVFIHPHKLRKREAGQI